jgi:hypothetical protein
MMEVREIPLGSVKDLPSVAGVYWVLAGESVLYVGQSANLRQRWVSHHRMIDMRRLEADRIRWLLVSAESLVDAERRVIDELQPVLNGRKRSVSPPISGSTTTAGLIKLGVTLDVDQLARLTRIARERHMPKSVIVRQAIEEMLNRLGVPA